MRQEDRRRLTLPACGVPNVLSPVERGFTVAVWVRFPGVWLAGWANAQGHFLLVTDPPGMGPYLNSRPEWFRPRNPNRSEQSAPV